MPKTSRPMRTADEIATMASRGEDVSAYFTNRFTVVRPVRRVNVDLTHGMLRELDERAARLNVSRQAIIKTLLARALSEDRVTARVSESKAGHTVRIKAVLEQLSRQDREVLTRFYVREQTQGQICSEMGLTDTQFRRVISRARARFMELGKKELPSRSLSAFFMRTPSIEFR
jgi:hypothetical protein